MLPATIKKLWPVYWFVPRSMPLSGWNNKKLHQSRLWFCCLWIFLMLGFKRLDPGPGMPNPLVVSDLCLVRTAAWLWLVSIGADPDPWLVNIEAGMDPVLLSTAAEPGPWFISTELEVELTISPQTTTTFCTFFHSIKPPPPPAPVKTKINSNLNYFHTLNEVSFKPSGT